MAGRLGWSLWGLAALLSAGVALYSCRYFAELGPHTPAILHNALAKPWLYLHIAGAATALLVSPLQFIPAWRLKGRGLHTVLGRVYVGGCLAGAAGGFVAAFGSFAGPVATAGFGALAVCWFTANVLGWRTALRRDFASHRRWMVRSFAMTFAAVTLRLDLAVFPLLHVAFIDGYRVVSWECWTLNLAVAELWLRRGDLRRLAQTAPSVFSRARGWTSFWLITTVWPRKRSITERT